MNQWLRMYSEYTYTAFRISTGLLFACHGAQKLFGVLQGSGPVSDPLMIAAGIIEFFGGLLVSLGFGAGYAAFISSGEMAVAYFRVHAPQGLWPINNKGELAVLYCFAFLYIAFRGSGRLSLEGMFRRKKEIRPH